MLAIALTACGPAEPKHDGKRLSKWFAGALDETANPRDVEDAFAAMGVETVPFLVRQVQVARQELAASLTNTPGSWLGQSVQHSRRALGLPAGAPSPDKRRREAYRLLAVVASRERERMEGGGQNHSHGLTNGFPLLREAFDQPRLNEWIEATDVVGAVGPQAAEFLPALLTLLTNAPPGDATVSSVVIALGRMGDAAVPAVPHLITLAGDARRPASERHAAAIALGLLGPASRPAAPVVTSLLSAAASKEGEPVSRGYVVSLTFALASLGETPDAAVPLLRELARHTDEWQRVPALIALWNWEPDDPELQAGVRNVLVSTNPNPTRAALTILTRLGTNAAVFAPRIRGLTNHPNPVIRAQAARCLQALSQ